MFRPLALSLSLSLALLAQPLAAQQTTLLQPCLDGPVAPALVDVSTALAGDWRMVATGMGMTTGTNALPVTLSVQPGTGALVLGGQGQATVLNILQSTRDAQGAETHDAPFDLAFQDLTPARLDPLEVEVLTGCANLVRVWWQMGGGNRRSWGALMFYDMNNATGFMANSAGGMRQVILSR